VVLIGLSLAVAIEAIVAYGVAAGIALRTSQVGAQDELR
jgi:hypothetical protein